MKKSLFLFCLLFILTPLAVAQNVNRNTVMPGFFIPDDALKTTSSQENLQANPMAQYRGKPLAKIYDMQSNQVSDVTNSQPTQQLHTQQNNVESMAAGPMPQLQNNVDYMHKPNINNDDNMVNFESVYQADSATEASSVSDLKSETDKIREALKHMSVEEYMQQWATEENTDTSSAYDKIFGEYKKDIEKIIKNKPVNNYLLDKMLSDYRDEDRHL